MIKSEHQSQHYRLEDDLIKRFPEQIASVMERIEGIEKDIERYAAEKEKCIDMQVSETGGVTAGTKFPGMTINSVEYHEKEPASKALLDACKGIKDRNTDVPIGEYMGFKLSLRYESFGQQINLLMRGAMTYQLELGTDALGNISRINNALDKLPERSEGAKSQLEDYHNQVKAAKLELEKPFEQEAELKEKEARLALLNADLNIDGNGDGNFDIINDTENRNTAGKFFEDDADDNYAGDEVDDEDYRGDYRCGSGHTIQTATAKSKPSILDGIHKFDSDRHGSILGNSKSTERDI